MLSPGTQLGQRYHLLDRIAVGGMGEVWRAKDTVLERRVAVKVLLPELVSEPGFAKRFQTEAKTVAALSHPHIVHIHDYGETTLASGATVAYLVMEFVEGRSLADLIEARGALPAAEMMPVIASIADALQHSHDHGVIHRDIKPGNILVRASNGEAVLTDFGIARSGSAGDLTRTGAVMGTASYIAPEQADGTGVIPASDMYSLGVVAYHGLTGHRPFHAENPIELALHHVRTPAPPLPSDIPPAVADFVQRSMSKNPAERFASAAEMAANAKFVAGNAVNGNAGHGPAGTNAPPPLTSVMPPVGPGFGQNAGVVGMSGPPAAVAEPMAASPHQPYGEINLQQPPGGPAGASRKSLIRIVAGVLALIVVGGMVWLLLQSIGDGDGGGDGDNPGGGDTSDTVDESEEPEQSNDPSPTPSADQDDTGDDDGGPFGCLPNAPNCDD